MRKIGDLLPAAEPGTYGLVAVGNRVTGCALALRQVVMWGAGLAP
jgi:hypothetical protein